MIKLLSEIETFVTKEIAVIDGDAKKLETELLNLATEGSNLLEVAKNWAASPEGKTLVSIIEALPVVGPIASEIVNTILPKAISAVTTVQADATEPETLIAAGLTAIGQGAAAEKLTVDYNSVAALATNDIAPLLNVKATLPAILSVMPSVYSSLKALV